MEDVGLIWNPKKCAVAHFKRGVRVADSTGLLRSDGNVKIPTLEDGEQYKSLGVLERGLFCDVMPENICEGSSP